MVEEHLRHCMLYEFQLGRNAKDAVKNICSALGEYVFNDRKCQRWFKKFRSGNLSLKNEALSGRVSAFNKNALQARLIEAVASSVPLLTHMTEEQRDNMAGEVFAPGAYWKLLTPDENTVIKENSITTKSNKTI